MSLIKKYGKVYIDISNNKYINKHIIEITSWDESIIGILEANQFPEEFINHCYKEYETPFCFLILKNEDVNLSFSLGVLLILDRRQDFDYLWTDKLESFKSFVVEWEGLKLTVNNQVSDNAYYYSLDIL